MTTGAGRPEQAISAKTPQLRELAAALRQIRASAGSPTYRQMGERAHYAASSLSGAASGRLPSWEVVAAYLRACDAKDQHVADVRGLWEQAVASTVQADPDGTDDLGEDDEVDDPPVTEQADQPHPGAGPEREDPGRGWWRPQLRRRAVPIGVTIVVLAALIVGAVLVWPGPCDSATTSEAATGECIGVSAGEFVFSPDLADVSAKIAAQNSTVDQRIAVAPRLEAVSIAFLMPYPPPTDTRGVSLAVGLRRELQGAYVAQLRANTTNEVGGRAPLVRLLLANAGDGNAQWPTVVDQLIEMARPGAEQRLVGVIGFGQSLDTSRDAITALNRARIATIVSRLTADDLAGEPGAPVNGFARIAPTNTDQVAAAVSSLRRTTRQVMVIRDSNTTDLYTTTLGSQFAASYPDADHAVVDPVEFYDSSLPAIENSFYQLTPTICSTAQEIARSAGAPSPPLTIYFAGRSSDLTAFVSALGNRSCPTIPITVFTGDDGGEFATTVQAQAAQQISELRTALRTITVRFTTLANPGAWKTDPQGKVFSGTSYFTETCAGCYPTLFPRERRDDDSAIIGHDAMFAATLAIRGLVDQRSPVLPEDAAGGLIQQLYRLHDDQAVPGASGRISFDRRGDPQRKPVPIVQVQPNGEVSFVELATGN